MAKLNLKTVNKKTKDQLITFVLVIAVYIVVQIMVAAGAISSLMQGTARSHVHLLYRGDRSESVRGIPRRAEYRSCGLHVWELFPVPSAPRCWKV